MSFVHLHVHSHYSLLDGLPKIDGLINRAKELGMPALALTDHGVMYGAIEFYQKAKAAGLKPIIGMEGYLAPGSRFTKNQNERPWHQILLAQNRAGYENLMKLSSLAHLEGFYYKPRFDKELLRQFSAGLIATSSCLKGEIPRAILAGGKARALPLIQEYQDIFGKENFYLEVQDHPEIPEQKTVNQALLELAQDHNLPVIAAKDVHYLAKEDAEAQDILVCIQTGKTVAESNRLDMRGVDLSFSSEEDMAAAFPHHPEVIAETVRLAERCELELDLGKFFFPIFALPADQSADDYLQKLAQSGLEKKYQPVPADYQKRLDYELEIIKKKGFAAYLLIVADYTNWARSQGIISTTRGSAAGSLSCHALGITTINPMTYQIPFERFLNPERPSAPDIDMDFADDRRDEVLNYVRAKYGQNKVAQICTFGTMLARGAVRDVGRALGYPYSFCDRVAKMIPFGRQGFPMTIKRALAEAPELKTLYESEGEARRLLDIAQKVEGSARHPSVHAAGVVISPTDLTDFTPLQKETGGEKIITQYDMQAVEEAGLVKMDLLGIRNLSILETAIRIIRQTKGVDIDIDNLPLADEPTFALLSSGQTMGIFQLGGSGMTRYLVDLKPSKITDIMAMVALFRPGPMESIPEFIARKHNPSQITYLDERLRPILGDSYGIITYQDDVLYIALAIAGYNWAEADKLRKAMGKKIPAEMAKQKDKFTNGCIEYGQLPLKKAIELWKLIEPFAAYGFNKAHAASYGMVAYQTAYLKAHFPAEFMAAVMTAESGDIEKVAAAVAECRALGITVLPPDINESFATFTVIDDKTIRFGLSAIKNIGSHIVEVIIAERKERGPYRDLVDFLERITDKDLNRKSLESLIKSGSFDSLGSRQILYANLDKLLAYARSAHEAAARRQSSLFAGSGTEPERLRLEPAPDAASEHLQWEKELLGLYLSGHPLDNYRPLLQQTGYERIDALTAGRATIRVCGLVIAVRLVATKRGELMAFAKVEDLTGQVEVIVFPDVYGQTKSVWQNDNILEIKATSEERNGTIQLICQEARRLLLDDKIPMGPAAYQSLEIELGNGDDVTIIAQLKELLYNYPGEAPVILHINGQKKLRLPVKVELRTELIVKLQQLVGDRQIKISNNSRHSDAFVN